MSNSFLYYLKENLVKEDFEKIILPRESELLRLKKTRSNKISVLRLDGCDNVKANLSSFASLLKKKEVNSPSYLKYIDFFEIIPSKILNLYLSRHAIEIIKKTNAIIFQSKVSKKMYEKLLGIKFLDLENHIIFNGTKYINYEKNRKKDLDKYGFPACVTSANKYKAVKRLDQTAILCRKLQKYYPNLKLHVLGNPTEIINLNKNLYKNNFIVFHGLLKYSSLKKFLKNMDLQFHLSYSDACPNAVVEGLMSSLPIICPKGTGTAELLGEISNKWSIDENLDIKFYPLAQNLSPKINYENYINLFHIVIESLEENRKIAHAYAAENLDIKLIAKKYKNVLN